MKIANTFRMKIVKSTFIHTAPYANDEMIRVNAALERLARLGIIERASRWFSRGWQLTWLGRDAFNEWFRYVVSTDGVSSLACYAISSYFAVGYFLHEYVHPPESKIERDIRPGTMIRVRSAKGTEHFRYVRTKWHRYPEDHSIQRHYPRPHHIVIGGDALEE